MQDESVYAVLLEDKNAAGASQLLADANQSPTESYAQQRNRNPAEQTSHHSRYQLANQAHMPVKAPIFNITSETQLEQSTPKQST